MRIILHVLVNAAALWIAAVFVPGITYKGLGSLLAISLVFGLVNAFIRPILKVLSLPVIVLTLGLFTIVINALMLMLTAWLGRHVGIQFYVSGFVSALIGSIIISIVSIC